MGGGLEADLSHGAVAALWRSSASAAASWRPVLQVADVRHGPDGSGLSPAPEQPYRLDLSDGVHSQPGTLDASLNHFARDGPLRRGSVIRVLDFVCDCYRRTITILQLQILQTECSLIGSLKLYESTRRSGGFTSRSVRYALRPNCEPYSGGQHIQQSCGGSNPAGRDTLCSDAPLAEPAIWKMIGQIKDENLGYSDKPDFVTVKAVISFVNTERLCSAACPLVANGKRCNVKATCNGNGTWHCKSCGQSFGSCDDGAWHCKRCGHSFESCDYGYSVRIQIQDHTGMAFATAYEEAAKEIFGCTGKDLYLMEYEKQDYDQLDDIIMGAVCKQYVLQLKVGKKFSDGHHMECVVLKAEKVNPSAESRRLLGSIDTLLEEGLGSCCEFGSSMPSYSGLSDIVRSSNSSHAISPGRARWVGSADRFGQQVNSYAVEPSALSAFGACGCDDHGPDIHRQRSSAPDGFVDRFYGASPAVKIAPDVPWPSIHRTRASARGAERSPRKP
ncbi:Replication protein A 70 kDa DNA-binding subunit C [Dichanthelium oligosanthes]|uniref:Replication protein A 70 kDa DNA-binding subunit C n=1 Tax=Dichanthelium oligosanthes TaxID=888268 RepID=A0A1E5WJ38_9POAL|nr:Replication protein A 70 kDa DNA-binding subunit C [Dichanthelium oligosanthes]